MPAFVKTDRDERLWSRAKALADRQGHGGDYAYITGIYKRMKGETPEKSHRPGRIFRFYDLISKAKELPVGHISRHADGSKWKKVSMKPPRWEQVGTHEQAAEASPWEKKKWSGRATAKPTRQGKPQSDQLKDLQTAFLDKAFAALAAGRFPFFQPKGYGRWEGEVSTELNELQSKLKMIDDWWNEDEQTDEELAFGEKFKDHQSDAEHAETALGKIRNLKQLNIESEDLTDHEYEAHEVERLLARLAEAADYQTPEQRGVKPGPPEESHIRGAREHRERIHDGLPEHDPERAKMLAYAFSAFSSLYDNTELPDGYKWKGISSGENAGLPIYTTYTRLKSAVLQDEITEEETGAYAGRVKRTLRWDRDEDVLSVDHSYFFLEKFAQGDDIGKKVLSGMIAQYKEMGIDQVTVEPAEVGCYAWAKYGFEWTSTTDDPGDDEDVDYNHQTRHEAIVAFLENDEDYDDAGGNETKAMGMTDMDDIVAMADELADLSALELANLTVKGERLGKKIMMSHYGSSLWGSGGKLTLHGKSYEQFKAYAGEG